MKYSIILLFLFFSSQQCSANIDEIPYLSQVKSFFLFLGGDQEGAIRTQEKFINETLYISQIYSLKQIIDGEKDAKEIQEQFGKILEETVNQTPIVGHIKVKY